MVLAFKAAFSHEPSPGMLWLRKAGGGSCWYGDISGRD